MWPEFDKEEDIPEGFRAQYEKVADGKWKAKVVLPEGTPTPEDLESVKGALQKERELRAASEKAAQKAEAARKAAEQKLAAEAAGMTDSQLQELRQAVRADLTEEYAAIIKERDDKIASLESTSKENRELKLDMAVKQLMLSKAVGVRGDRVNELFRLAEDQFDLTEDGKPKLVKHPGKTIEQFLAGDLKQKYPEFYIGTNAGGGGAGGAFTADGSMVHGTTAADIMKNPAAALQAGREAGAGR